jgi:ubiquinone/menaquinone biosynthesis C-methylase UbiE
VHCARLEAPGYGRVVNENHKLCSSPEWAEWLQTKVLPYLVRDVDLGEKMLEVGPGPGAATEWLRHRVRYLVTIEADREAADKLTESYGSTNVTTIVGDATAMVFDDGSFDSAGCFTMLHHVPSAAAQNRLLAEVLRVLRPGGALIGSDSLPSDRLHGFHEADTYNPVEPGTFIVRLQTLGFDRITVNIDDTLRFIAHKPTDDPTGASS